MGTIDTIQFRDQSVRIGAATFKAMDEVPYRVWFQVIVAMMIAKSEKRKSRRDLTKLSACDLRDIGLTEEQADFEIRKSFPLYQRVDRT